jgi:competence protein ComEC
MGAGLAAKTASLVRARPYHAALAAFAVGLASAAVEPRLVVPAAAAALAVAASLRAWALGPVCASLLLAGAVVGSARLDAIDAPGRRVPSGTVLDGRADVLEAPRPSRFGSRAVIRMRSAPGSGANLLARAGPGVRWPRGVGIGAELHVRGVVRRPRPARGGAFDFGAYLRLRGIAAELWLTGVHATGRRRGGLRGAIDGMRRRAERAVSAGLRPQAAALLRGMVLGQDEDVDERTRDDWRAAGLAHLLAVSGQNVMLLCALAMPILALVGLGPHARIAALLVLIAVYVALAGAGPSLQRAGVMGAAGLAAVYAGRAASRWYALLLAAAATLVLNPRVAGDPGWQLSFAAVAGILCLVPALRPPLAGLPRPLAEGVAITLAATVATAPLLAYHFGSVPLTGLPANLLALPAVAPVMWTGMLQAALGQLGTLAEPAGTAAVGLAELLGLAAAPLVDYLAELAARFAEATGSGLRVPLSSPSGVAVAYLATGLAAVAIQRAGRRVEPAVTARRAAWRRLPRGRRRAVLACVALLVALGVQRALAPPAHPDRLTVSFLDVGQGDATLIQHPEGGAVLFDGGPPEGRVWRLLRKAGVRRLAAVVATHASRDHHGGLRRVLESYPVDLLLDGGDGTRDSDFRAMLAVAERRRVRRQAVTAPLVVRAGGLVVRVLSPPPRPPGPAPEDPNPRGVTAVVSAGAFDLFLSADVESPSLTALRLPDVEAMKVPHHGSADPGLPEILSRLRPEIAAVEVGRDNGYGHPAPRTLAALREAGARTYRTDQDGTIRLTVEAGRMRVATER